MTRLLERIDGLGGVIVVLLYLGGLGLGTVAYFTGLSTVIGFGWSVGFGLAAAVELHSWLVQRRVFEGVGNWLRARRSPQPDEDRLRAVRGELIFHCVIWAVLIGFSMFNSMMFVQSFWKPTAPWPPYLVQVVLRGSIIPVLFAMTAALTPLHTDAHALLTKASHDMLAKTIRQTRRQWEQRLQRAFKDGRNLAPIAVALLEDAGDGDGAQRIRLIDDGLARAEGASMGPGASVGAIVSGSGGRTALPPAPRQGIPVPQPAPASIGLGKYRGMHDGDGMGRRVAESEPIYEEEQYQTVDGGREQSNSGNGYRHTSMSESTASLPSLIAPSAYTLAVNPGTVSVLELPDVPAFVVDEADMTDGTRQDFYHPEIDLRTIKAPASRPHAAREQRKDGHSQGERREWEMRREAKADPGTSNPGTGTGLPKAKRWDSDVALGERDERNERKVRAGVEILWNAEEDGIKLTGTQLRRDIAQEVYERYSDTSGCTVHLAQRARTQFEAEKQREIDAKVAQYGPEYEAEHALPDFTEEDFVDEVQAGDREGYGTSALPLALLEQEMAAQVIVQQAPHESIRQMGDLDEDDPITI